MQCFDQSALTRGRAVPKLSTTVQGGREHRWPRRRAAAAGTWGCLASGAQTQGAVTGWPWRAHRWRWLPGPRPPLPPSSGLAYLVLQLQHLLPELLQLLAGQCDDLLQLLLQHLLAVADSLQLGLQGLDSLLAAGREAGLGHRFPHTQDRRLPRSPHAPHPPPARAADHTSGRHASHSPSRSSAGLTAHKPHGSQLTTLTTQVKSDQQT